MISIIIPAYNEAGHIATTIKHIRQNGWQKYITEIIVTDGQSTDDTLKAALKAGAQAVTSPKKGRAAQMNYGASIAKGAILYFIHADTIPAYGFTNDIVQAVKNGYGSGCYRLSFDHAHWFLKANCWFTRFDRNAFRFGDQSLFVTKKVFEQCGGFNELLIVMEDQEIIQRLKRFSKFLVIQKTVITSARKYLLNGVYKTQGIFFLIYLMYYLGYPQQTLVNTYKKLIRQNKI